VARIEEVLEAAARRSTVAPASGERHLASHALWICACVTMDEAPTWLIYDTEGRVAWHRVADAVEPMDLVDAQFSAGGHADPIEVLRWLRGEALDPWGAGGYGSGDVSVLEELGRSIRLT